MTSVQIHLALTHVPVILSITASVMLAATFIFKNPVTLKTSYILLLIAGIAAVPVFLTGEGAEEAVEHMPGVSEAIIESHEEMATAAFYCMLASGLLALAALFFSKQNTAGRILKNMLLLLSIATAGLMIETAHLGGQIRHTEIQAAGVQQNGNENNAGQQGEKGEKEKKDDD